MHLRPHLAIDGPVSLVCRHHLKFVQGFGRPSLQKGNTRQVDKASGLQRDMSHPPSGLERPPDGLASNVITAFVGIRHPQMGARQGGLRILQFLRQERGCCQKVLPRVPGTPHLVGEFTGHRMERG